MAIGQQPNASAPSCSKLCFGATGVLIQIRNALDPPVGYACGVKQLRVDALVAFAGARFARQAAFGAAVVQTAVVFQLVELLVV